MSEPARPKIAQVNAARAIAVMNQRLGEQTPDWIMKIASARLPSDPADQETWSPQTWNPLVGRR